MGSFLVSNPKVYISYLISTKTNCTATIQKFHKILRGRKKIAKEQYIIANHNEVNKKSKSVVVHDVVQCSFVKVGVGLCGFVKEPDS